MPTIRQALNNAKQHLTGSDTPALDAQVLLEFVLGVERVYLFAHSDEDLTPDQHNTFQALIQRRLAGEPIPYITGTKGFYDLDLIVTSDVLIPRPETELLLEEALRLLHEKPNSIIADIGTGSGALAVTVAVHMPHSQVIAIDISPSALQVAQANFDRHQVKGRLWHGNLAQPLIEHDIQVDLLMANLPYIRRDEMPSLAVSQHEPHLALDGGDDGLDLIRDLLQQLPQVCRAGAWVLLEIGADQGDALQTEVQSTLGVSCDILQDYAGLDRIGRFQL